MKTPLTSEAKQKLGKTIKENLEGWHFALIAFDFPGGEVAEVEAIIGECDQKELIIALEGFLQILKHKADFKAPSLN